MGTVKFKSFLLTRNVQEHPFHLVNPSLWPLTMALSLYNLFIILIAYFNNFFLPSLSFNFGFWTLELYSPIFYLMVWLFFLSRWLTDIIREATFEGYHTLYVQFGIYLGMVLFILSEIMFFFSFFWAFFHVSLSPNFYLGLIWPPEYLNILDPYSLPLWNTIILLSSGITVTYAHRGILAGSRYASLDGLYWTVLYGVFFTLIQGYEYCYSDYSINDGVFGSIFFLLTGFHGIHVLIGTIFLFVCLYRHIDYHFTRQHHVGLELGILYWHMVDAIWLFLFACIYL